MNAPEFSGLPAPLVRLAESLTRLPGVGRKTALRMAYALLRMTPEVAEEMGSAIADLHEKIVKCRICFHLTDAEICSICRSPRRANGLLCIVEEPMDLLAIERSGTFQGRYHVLEGVLNPLAGVGPERLRIEELYRRLDDADEPITEVILATNPTPEGDATAAYLRERIAERGIRATRIAYGLPSGADLEYIDGETIARALENRRDTG